MIYSSLKRFFEYRVWRVPYNEVSYVEIRLWVVLIYFTKIFSPSLQISQEDNLTLAATGSHRTYILPTSLRVDQTYSLASSSVSLLVSASLAYSTGTCLPPPTGQSAL